MGRRSIRGAGWPQPRSRKSGREQRAGGNVMSTLMMRWVATAALVLAGSGLEGTAAQDNVLFWSSQATPVTEAQAMRDTVLPDFEGEVDFQPQDPGAFMTRI